MVKKTKKLTQEDKNMEEMLKIIKDNPEVGDRNIKVFVTPVAVLILLNKAHLYSVERDLNRNTAYLLELSDTSAIRKYPQREKQGLTHKNEKL